jgi:hypothetical protein
MRTVKHEKFDKLISMLSECVRHEVLANMKANEGVLAKFYAKTFAIDHSEFSKFTKHGTNPGLPALMRIMDRMSLDIQSVSVVKINPKIAIVKKAVNDITDIMSEMEKL